MQDFINKKIVLGICGGIAAYKSAYLVRELTRLGAEVRVVMTESAQQFITPLTLQALSGFEVRVDLFDSHAERAMGHIELARWADFLVVAPASANCLAKMAQGLADDLLTTLYLVTESPVILCPAMNKSMWNHPAMRHNYHVLRDRGAIIVGPEEGVQACGDFGYGRMSEVDEIISALRLYSVHHSLLGQQVMITAGPTQEAIDPVRFISNQSSGKMGYALAEACKIAGAEVTLISGPTSLSIPSGLNFHPVNTAKEMQEKVMSNLQEGMIFIGCAAVADFAIKSYSEEKIKKQANHSMSIELIPNPDIVAGVVESAKASYVVGFAAETNDLIKHAKSKLTTKKLNMIIANRVGNGLGFAKDYNEAIVITANEQIQLHSQHKTRLAGQIIAILAATLHNEDQKI